MAHLFLKYKGTSMDGTGTAPAPSIWAYRPIPTGSQAGFSGLETGSDTAAGVGIAARRTVGLAVAYGSWIDDTVATTRWSSWCQEDAAPVGTTGKWQESSGPTAWHRGTRLELGVTSRWKRRLPAADHVDLGRRKGDDRRKGHACGGCRRCGCFGLRP